MKKILFLIALAPFTAQAGWFGNYDDCILVNMKGIQSNSGVAAVKAACRSKYPSKEYVPAKCKNLPPPPQPPQPPEIREPCSVQFKQ